MFIVFDIDGTLSDVSKRLHLVKQDPPAWDAFFAAAGGDDPVWPIVGILKAMAHDHTPHRIEIWTGRPERMRGMTLRWLDACGIKSTEYEFLKMRDDDDFARSDELKKRWLHEQREMPDLVFEDNLGDVAMWRTEGIHCVQTQCGLIL